MNINLHIERLILDRIDVSYREWPLVQAALETELAQLLATTDIASGLQAGGTYRSARAKPIQLTANNSPTHLGQQIALAVHRGISRRVVTRQKP